MGGVASGSPVSASNTNSAFLEKNADDATIGKVGLQNVDPTNSGAFVVNVQGEINGLDTFLGRTPGAGPASLPTWTNNDVGTGVDDVKTRADVLTARFNSVTGHGHTGTTGDGPKLAYLTALNGIQLQGRLVQGATLASVSGGTTDVSTQLAAQLVSTGQTVPGVVTNAPPNIVNIFDQNGESILDGAGHKVYARLTNTGGPSGTWTLTYYSLVSGIETPYTFSTPATNVAWYYQYLYNETNRPVYSDQILLNSDQIAGDIPSATISVQGKVLLASSNPADVGASASYGTANATVANADHVHRGVGAITDGTTTDYGTITFTGSGGTTCVLSGGTMTITGTTLGAATPQPVGPVGAVGTATAASREDHVHAGLHSITISGPVTYLGDIVLDNGNNTTWSQPSAGHLRVDVGGFSTINATFTMADNQASPATILTVGPLTGGGAVLGAIISYHIQRGASGQARTGVFIINSDSVNVNGDDGPSYEIGDTGVVLSVTQDGTNILFQYTSTATGTAPVITYECKKVQ